MKKLLLLFVSLVAFCSCDNEEFDFTAPVEAQSEIAVDSFYVSFEEALAQAEKMLAGTTATRASATKRKVANHHEYVANRNTRATGDDVEVRFHVINFEDNQGFALVSADSRTTPVYAYSETGNLDIEDATENTGFGDFMDAATEYYIAEAEWTDPDNPLLPTDPNNQILPITPVPTNPILHLPIVELDGERYYWDSWEVVSQNSAGRIVPVIWGQGWPYNFYCDSLETENNYLGNRYAVGCGPLAVGQILSVYRYPISLDNNIFNWNKIMLSNSYNETYTDGVTCSEGAMATAYMLRAIGENMNAVYGEETSVTINNIYSTLRNLKYNFAANEYRYTDMINSLNSNYPVIICGLDSYGFFGGHAWVVDSHQKVDEYETYYHSYEPYDVAFRNEVIGERYFHCIWGDSDLIHSWCLDVFEYFRYYNNKWILYNIRPLHYG